MSTRGKGEAPRPEALAAYVDGELPPAERAAVEAWLAGHPEAAAEVAALRRLSRLWEAAAPPEPSAPQWAALLAHIESALPAAAARRPLPWRRLVGGLAAGLAAAAVVLAVVLRDRPAEVVPPPAIEPLPVVTADDVEIIRIDARDAGALVVGEPPLREALALLGPGEVIVDQVKSDVQGMDPHFQQSGPPMIIMMPREDVP
jgi:anti-sigma factor RsiW